METIASFSPLRSSLYALTVALALMWLSPEVAFAQQSAPKADDAEIIKLPKVKKLVHAEYPARAAQERIEASVVLDIDVGTDGRVTDARLVTPADPPGYGFDEAALAAVRQFELEPAETKDGPIAVTISYKYSFAFTASAPAPVTENPAPPAAPRIALRGRLLERGTRTPIAGVIVTAFLGEGTQAHGLDATSDADGTFTFYDLASGDWRLLATPDGYFPLRTSETLSDNETLEVSYYVEKRSYGEFDVLVEARRPRKEVTRRTVLREEIEKVPGTFGDPIAVVANLPSVARVGFGDGSIIVRGSSATDTIITVDGTNVPYLYHFGGIRTAIPAAALDYLDFYPGNFSVYYGRATGGVLDIKLKRLHPEKLTMSIDTSFLDTGIFAAVPIGDKAAIAVGGRRSYIDVLMKQLIPSDGPVTMTTAPRYYDYQLMAAYRPTDKHELSAMFFGSDDRFELIFTNPADAIGADIPQIREASKFYRGVLGHTWRWSEQSFNEAKVTIGYDKEDADLGPSYYVRNHVTSIQARETATIELRPALSLRVGADYLFYQTTWDVLISRPPAEGSTPAEDEVFDSSEARRATVDALNLHFPAAFVEATFKPLDTVAITPGARVEYFDWVEETIVDPRLAVRWQANDALAFKGGAGVFHQLPEAYEIGTGFGNPDLRTLYAYHYSVGAEYRFLPFLSLDTTAFVKDIRRVVVTSERMIERDGALVPEYYNNNGRGRCYGIDFLVKHELAHNFFGWIAYTLSRSERRDNHSATFRLFDYDQTHILTLVGSYRLPHNWEIGGRWRLVSGNPATPVTGSVLNADNDTYIPLSGRTNSTRMPPFHQLDIRVDKRWIFDGFMLSAYMDIQNIYSRKNSDSFSYNYDYSEKTGSGGMSFLPIFGLRAEI